MQSPLAGELRLQSDGLFARDPATACFWQANVDRQEHMARTFEAAFAKLQVLGQDVAKLVDCSDVMPVPQAIPRANRRSFIPAGLSQTDVQPACATAAFPILPVAPGPSAVVAQMYVCSLHLESTDEPPYLSVQNPATQGACNDDGTDCVIAGFQ